MFVSSESEYVCVHIGLYGRPFRITTARSGPPAVVNDTVRVGIGATIGDNRKVDVEHESPAWKTWFLTCCSTVFGNSAT